MLRQLLGDPLDDASLSSDLILAKIARLRRRETPRVLDLFAGCGGLSLGFRAAGFQPAGAIESDPDAARSHGLNFHRGEPDHSRPRDITTAASSPERVAAELDLGPVGMGIDIVIGGPPCQAFARVGRPKLREIERHPRAFIQDPRAKLYLSWLHFVDAFAPLAVLMENVPDVMNHGGQNIAEEICDVLEERGFVCGYTLLNAAFYGVPQMRERMFLVGYRRELGATVSFPPPTHWVDLPVGYHGARDVALKALRAQSGFFDSITHHYMEPPAASRRLTPAVTAAAALSDLPPITGHLEGRIGRGARRLNDALPFPPPGRMSDYARLMRAWPGFEAASTLPDHVIRYLPRDWPIFRRMRPGDQYPEALNVARQLYDRAVARHQRSTGCPPTRSELEEIRRRTVPPYDPGKFPNKWRKMEADTPARTLMAHLGKDCYSHIHYDDAQARTISVREAARLQSFPDGFRFCGTMNPAFRQIGNAVPPLLARALAATMLSALYRDS